jgi:hypothetical protein
MRAKNNIGDWNGKNGKHERARNKNGKDEKAKNDIGNGRKTVE